MKIVNWYNVIMHVDSKVAMPILASSPEEAKKIAAIKWRCVEHNLDDSEIYPEYNQKSIIGVLDENDKFICK